MIMVPGTLDELNRIKDLKEAKELPGARMETRCMTA